MSKQSYRARQEAFLANTSRLAAFIVRRDRIRIPIWLIAITLTTVAVGAALADLFAAEQERQAIAETMANPAMIAMAGPGYGLDNYTVGAMMSHQMLLFTAIVVAIMSILLVTRHTRADEEDGRIEIIRSFPVGRLSNLSATTVVLFGTNLFLALLVGFGLNALGIESMNLEGSLLYGAALGAAGMFFAAVTALLAQLSEGSRGTLGLSFMVLGGAYLIRAIGDVSIAPLSWFSPLNWVLRSEVYVNNYWWPIIFTVIAALFITALALYLNSIRDLGAGFIAVKRGRKNASGFLQSPFGLGLRLQRGAITAWAMGMFVLGASYGSILGDLEAFFADSEVMREMLLTAEGFSLTEQYLAMLMLTIAILAAIPTSMMILRLGGEENKHRIEPVLTGTVSRTRIMGAYLAISIMVGLGMLLLAAIGLWSAGAAVMAEPLAFAGIFNAAMVYLPAIWMMIGLAVFLIGLLPGATSVIWLYLGYSFFTVYFGELLQIPDWLSTLSPFGNIPQLPVEEMNFTKVSILTAIAALLTVAGFSGYQKRDLQG